MSRKSTLSKNDMAKYLPSRKFIIFFGSVILIGVLIWVGSRVFSKTTSYKKTEDVADSLEDGTGNFYTDDSDKDGVYDWEEGLWGTSPNKKDSDGDGQSDGDDIKERKKAIQERNNVDGTVELSEDLNQTEMFARQLFSAASLANQSGGISPESLEDFSVAFGQSVTNAGITDLYRPSDLKLSAISPSQYKKYLGDIFKPYLESKLSAESAIYLMSTGDASASIDIEKLAEFHHAISNALITTEAPFAAAGMHLAMANNSAKISLSLLNIKNLEDDPILAMIGLRQYFEYSDEYEKAVVMLSEYFKANGII